MFMIGESMKLNKIKSNPLIDYETGKNILIKQFNTKNIVCTSKRQRCF